MKKKKLQKCGNLIKQNLEKILKLNILKCPFN